MATEFNSFRKSTNQIISDVKGVNVSFKNKHLSQLTDSATGCVSSLGMLATINEMRVPDKVSQVATAANVLTTTELLRSSAKAGAMVAGAMVAYDLIESMFQWGEDNPREVSDLIRTAGTGFVLGSLAYGVYKMLK